MNPCPIARCTMSVLLGASVFGDNLFVNASDDKRVSANFRGTESGDEIDADEIPRTARVITTRIATMPWGAIFKVEFTDLKSNAPQPRTIQPNYFIVTNDRIVLLNEEDNDDAARKIAALDNPPGFEPNDIYGITSGTFEHQCAL